MPQDKTVTSEDRSKMWPNGANDVPTTPVYSCTCGAVSSSPINHNHGTSSKR
ncbi:hypothetical protein [Microbispora sp. H10949]|uniref:hypothetical protein n=1 Tax=Microbispora sp. H10949 TaxID=2729111 RepID=UPI0015FF3703|nr:hypothetical protein [Microbispora sp. H10949]